MMKKAIFTITLLFWGLTAQLQNKMETCNISALKSKLTAMLGNYKYDSSKITHFSFNGNKQEKTISLPLFEGEHYKLLFNTNAMPDGVEINIYNESSHKNKKKLIYSNKKELKDGKKIFSFTPQKGNVLLIEYSVPKGENPGSVGCVVFLMGYQV